MATEHYNRFVVGSFNIVVKTIIVAACLMWLITLADVLLGLGWGWDKRGLWIGPIIVGLVVAVLLGSNVTFRLLGPASAKR